MNTRRQRQQENIRTTRLSEKTVEKMDAYAADNHLSRSELIRELITSWLEDKTPIHSVRRTKRISFWIDPNVYMRFNRKVQDVNEHLAPGLSRMTVADIIESELEKIL